MTPDAVIAETKAAKLRGRGGAGFPTGMKWEFARKVSAPKKAILCNGDEGEPGTFKDRVILTEIPERVFEGMALAGYAVGASEGILYLRGEYEYLRPSLEQALTQFRQKNLLGQNICGKQGFNFDIRIQSGAGAYICGEESALITSCEGGRGVPKSRPPFPAEKGYLGLPTVINNIETFCCAARVLEKGAAWFAKIGQAESAGTKLLSVSGDCAKPGVYELPFGVSVRQVLQEAGGENAQGAQIGGPSGTCINAEMFDRKISFNDLATGGSIMAFGPQRDILEVAAEFMEFFIEEGCGFCTPCRVGNVLIHQRLQQIRSGHGAPEDLAYLEELCKTVKKVSRCGLGQTSPNPVQSTLANFRKLYEAKLAAPKEGRQASFDLEAALSESTAIQGKF
jgi:[NiFe] hydrogenase diaphorase moiety large subunit